MSLIIAGAVRIPPENLQAFLPHMVEMMTASQAEAGCLAYSYAEQVDEPGLIRVFEVWRDQAAVDLHFKTEHMARWRSMWPSVGVTDRNLVLYDVAAERPL